MTAGMAEIRQLRAVWLTRLPAPVTLVCRAPDATGDVRDFWVTTSREHFMAAEQALPVLDGQQWQGLAHATHGRATALAVSQWLMPGLPFGDLPPWVIRGSIYDLLGGAWRPATKLAAADVARVRVTVGDVLEHFGAELVGLDPPPTPPRAGGLL